MFNSSLNSSKKGDELGRGGTGLPKKFSSKRGTSENSRWKKFKKLKSLIQNETKNIKRALV